MKHPYAIPYLLTLAMIALIAFVVAALADGRVYLVVDGTPQIVPSQTNLFISGSPTADEDGTEQYTAWRQLDNGNSNNVSASAVWTEDSADTTIASGLLTVGSLTENGSVNITASYGGFSDTNTVTLLGEDDATGLQITGASSITESNNSQYAAYLAYESGTSNDVAGSAVWDDGAGLSNVTLVAGLVTVGDRDTTNNYTFTATYGGFAATNTISIVGTPEAPPEAPVAGIYPDEGLFTLSGVDYTGFLDSGLSLTNTSPAYSYEVAEWTRVAENGESIVAASDDTAPEKWLATDGQTEAVLDATTNDYAQGSVIAISGLAYPAMYTIWPQDASTNHAAAIQVNRTEAFFALPNAVSVGDKVSIAGTAMQLTNTVASKVWCVEEAEWVTSSYANFYRMEFVVPAGWTNGTKTLYAHNGYGKEYGISPRAVSITVVSANTYTSATNTPASTSWADVQTAMGATVAGETLKFGTGTYEFDTDWNDPPNGIQILGDGIGNTIIKPSASYSGSGGHNCLIDAGSTTGYDLNNARISGITFDMGAADYNLHSLLNIVGSNTVVENCSFVITNALGLGGSFKPDDAIARFAGQNGHITVRNCEFHFARQIGLGEHTYFVNNTMYGYNRDVTGNALSGSDFNIMVISNSAAQANPATADLQYWCGGRMITHLCNYGSTYNEYFEGNTATDWDPPVGSANDNSGEDFLWEGVRSWFSDTPASATSNTVVFSVLNTNNTEYVYTVGRETNVAIETNTLASIASDVINITGSWGTTPVNNTHVIQVPSRWYSDYEIDSTTSSSVNMKISPGSRSIAGTSITITDGPGFGQTRGIVSVDQSTGTVTVDEAWRVNPTTGSTLMIHTSPRKIVVFANNIEGNDDWATHNTAGALFSVWGGGTECYVDGNTLDKSEEGIAMCSYPYIYNASEYTHTVSPVYFNTIRNNTFTRLRQFGLGTFVYNNTHGTDHTAMDAAFANVFTGNTVSNAATAYTLSSPFTPAVVDVTVLDGNTFIDCASTNISGAVTNTVVIP